MTNPSKMIRVWKQLDISHVKKHLLLIDDHYGICDNCKQTGLKYLENRKCIGCGTEFKYLSTKLTSPGEVGKILSRIQKENLSLQVIDRSDFERSRAKENINSLFKT